MAQVQAIAKVVTRHLNHVVTTCVMNQFGGHWLLLIALTTIINLIVVVEFEVDPIVNENVTFDLFDVELHMLNVNLWHNEVIKVIKYFLKFFKTFDSHQVQNMLTLMLDPQMFKSLWVVKGFVGYGNAIHFTIKYDVKEIIPLFMTIFLLTKSYF
jgi:hypothetical protein